MTDSASVSCLIFPPHTQNLVSYLLHNLVMLAAVREAKVYYLSFSKKLTLGQCFSSAQN